MATLPPELVELVVDQLADDRPALAACSLAHSSCTRRARHHLFRRVCLNEGPRGARFRALVDAAPHLGRFVREVELCGTTLQQTHLGVFDLRWPTLTQGRAGPSDAAATDHSTDAAAPAPAHWLERVLPQSPTVLARTTTLRLTGLAITPALAAVLEAHFAAVTTVALDACRAPSFADLCALPRALRAVQHLYLLDAHWLRAAPALASADTPAPAPDALATLHPPTLQTLVLSGKVDAATVLTWLVAERRFAALTSLVCDVSGVPAARALRPLLHALGPSLQYLGIGFSAVRDATEVLTTSALTLAPCTGLARLDLLCTSATRAASLSWTIALLARLASPRLAALAFRVPAAHAAALNLDVLAVVLAHQRYTALRRVEFVVEVRGAGDGGKSAGKGERKGREELEERLRTRLAALVARGVELSITYQPPARALCPPRRVAPA
ncbi:hypothetical protein EIP86_007786 [Pleurotus ostreatoroseus]|nr:hypothetical protein EIP86_007786 [Pleurotus ostreatoroseus]